MALTRVRIATSLASEGRHAEATQALRELEPLLERDWRREGMGAPTLRADTGYTQWQVRRFPEAVAATPMSFGR